MMITKNSYIFLLLLLLGLSSCERDFLGRKPLTSLTDEFFFNTASDLETYTNGLYGLIGAETTDFGSDNIALHTGGNTMDRIVTGAISSATIGGWNDWSNLRSINFFLDNTKGDIVGSKEDINHFIGIARFFRAKFYYEKVKLYSDVPWFNTALDVDNKELYKAADARTVVVDNIMEDLQFAVDHIKPTLGSKTRINRYAALTLMARISLHEGTYRKYHPELNLASAYEPFLQKALWAAQEIMKSNEFGIDGGVESYDQLFNSHKINGLKETILVQEADQGLGKGNDTHAVFGWQWALSRSLVESYLMADGSRLSDQPDYDKKSFLEIFKDRDPRLMYTVAYPGFKQTLQGKPIIPSPLFGGYNQLKFYPKDQTLRQGWGKNYTSLPIYRYGEVLLIYAEAKAEMNQLSQGDLDESINLLRRRVQLPDLNLTSANSSIDPLLEKYYPNVTSASQGVILEIRRERRVELACEGLRQDDLKRWGVGERFADAQEGIYIPALGAYDMTGDGKPDLAILESPDDLSLISHLSAEDQKDLSKYYLKKNGQDEGIYLTEGTKGHIAFTTNKLIPRNWKSPQYYYQPIPKQQLLLNDNLKQPFGWE